MAPSTVLSPDPGEVGLVVPELPERAPLRVWRRASAGLIRGPLRDSADPRIAQPARAPSSRDGHAHTHTHTHRDTHRAPSSRDGHSHTHTHTHTHKHTHTHPPHPQHHP